MEGLALIRSVGDNLLSASLQRVFPGGWFSPQRASQVAVERITQLRIVTPGPLQIAQKLSGGNQQKIVIGKWLNADAKLFLFDEPTRGIDVGAKAEVFAVIAELVRRGAAVLMITSELSEITNPGGHLKFLHPWPGQTPPPLAAGRGDFIRSNRAWQSELVAV